MRAISIHAAFAANEVKGMRFEAAVFEFLIRFSTWPWRRCRHSRVTGSPGWLVSTTWWRIPLWSHNRSCAPGFPHDRSGPGRPAVGGEVQLGDLGASTWLTIGVDRWPPGGLHDVGDAVSNALEAGLLGLLPSR